MAVIVLNNNSKENSNRLPRFGCGVLFIWESKNDCIGDCCRRLLPFLTPFSETEKGIALQLNTFIKCQMLQEALLHQGEICREFLSQFKYCNSNLVKIHFILLNPGMKSVELDWGPSDQAAEQSYFLKEEFHYLDVTQIGKLTIFDMFHCTLACLRNNLCLSLNMATSHGTDGKLWCELLSSDKNRNAGNYHKNTSSHHFSILRVRTL